MKQVLILGARMDAWASLLMAILAWIIQQWALDNPIIFVWYIFLMVLAPIGAYEVCTDT